MAFARQPPAPAVGNIALLSIVLVLAALAVSAGVTSASLTYAVGALTALVLFALVFVRTDFGIYVVIFSMLLSPEFTTGGGLAEQRTISLRTEDFILVVIGFSWFAKTAVNKELGLVAKTPLNRPIAAYIVATTLATLVGYLTGTVKTAAGFFYVLKYIEYFFVYFMVVNNLRDRSHAWRMVVAAFLTAGVVSLVRLFQIPSGERVSAPFEGEVGEPNTFGGYLLLMMAIVAGVALETTHLRARIGGLGLLGLLLLPFLFTLSRASYLGAGAAALALVGLSTRRRFMVGLLLLTLVCAPLLLLALPGTVIDRVLYTFRPEYGNETFRLGRLAFDPSTSARLFSFQRALESWLERPLLGYGVTGFRFFMDAQYARALVETGVIGLATLLGLLWAVIRGGLTAARTLTDPQERGLALGFVAGTIGLAVHAIGSNTFIIVRIMEPFWLFAGIVTMLPQLERGGRVAPVPVPARRPAGRAA